MKNDPPPRRIDRVIDRLDVAKFFSTWGRRKPEEPETAPKTEPPTNDDNDSED
jgi:hypothetical protein